VVDDRAGSWRLEDLIPKTLSLLHEWVPRAKRIDMVNQANDPGHAVFAKVMLDAAQLRGLGCKVFQVRDEGELVTTIAGSTADALHMIATQMIYARPGRVAATAVERSLPLANTGGPARDPTASGIRCSYCHSQRELYSRAADCVDRILRGAKAADIPVAQPLRYEFIINLKTVRAMGLTIPRALWLRTDETIE